MDVYLSALHAGAAALGLSVTDALAKGLWAHQALVAKWAQKMNLTTVLAPAEAAIKHGLDSLLFAEFFNPDAEYITFDVGSGAGFPGIPLALARPGLKLTLLEPQRKRASFLRVALTDLGLKSVRVVEGRLEPLKSANGPWQAEKIVSRATIPPLELAQQAAAYLVPEGELILSGGSGAPAPEQLSGALSHQERRTFVLPGGDPRHLDRLRRVG